ncbi:ABC transporter permease [Peribacillus frigoritolerans]|uniref:ABC transporter permease n=1 Tax=Peribacillus frigoritolerans TaxID=450367 RepID=UPI003B8DAF3C
MLASEKLKLKRTLLIPISYIYPVAVILLSLLIVGLQKDNLAANHNNMWESMVVVVHYLYMFTIPLAITVVTSNLINLEHQTNSWKLLYSLPVNRSSYYFSKLFYILFLCSTSAVIVFIGLIVIGKVLNFGGGIPFLLLLKESFFPLIGALPIITFQLWLSLKFSNQVFPIGIGVFSAVCVFFLQINKTTSLIFWAYPAMMSPVKQIIENGSLTQIVVNNDLSLYMLLSFSFGLVFMLIGLVHCTKKQVN